MSMVELNQRNIKGIVIDGHIPNFSYFKELDWQWGVDEKLSISLKDTYHFKKNIYDRFLSPNADIPKVGPRSNFYRRLANSLRGRFCQYNKELCAQFQYPVQGVWDMEKFIFAQRKEVRDTVWPVFSREIENDSIEGDGNYIFTFAFLDQNPENCCASFNECSANWMDFMGFTSKTEKDYVDFVEYKEAAEILLKSNIDLQRNLKKFEQ